MLYYSVFFQHFITPPLLSMTYTWYFPPTNIDYLYFCFEGKYLVSCQDQLIISAWNCCPESNHWVMLVLWVSSPIGAAGLQGRNTVQAALVFLLLSWCLLCGCCFDCHIGPWSLRKPDSIWLCFEGTTYWQATAPVHWSCLQCLLFMNGG